MRSNFVGERPVGQGTTISNNPHTFDAYFLLNATIGYNFFKEKFNFQYTINNIFDHQYYSPGIRSATSPYTSRIPQFGRNMYFRLSLKF